LNAWTRIWSKPIFATFLESELLHGFKMNGRREQLEMDDVLRCIRGKEMLANAQALAVIRCFDYDDDLRQSCKTPTHCPSVLSAGFSKFDRECPQGLQGLYALHDDAALIRSMLKSTPKRACTECQRMSRTRQLSEREKIWNMLPTFFDLGFSYDVE